MGEAPLGPLVRYFWQIACATAQSVGGVWATNLVPGLAASAERCCRAGALNAAWIAAQSPDAGAAVRQGFRLEAALAHEAIQAFVRADSDRATEYGLAALTAGAAFFARIASLPIAPAQKRDWVALAEGLTALSKVPLPTSRLAHEITTARVALARSPCDQELKDRLFDLESRQGSEK